MDERYVHFHTKLLSLSLFLSVRTLHFDYMMPKIEADKELDASVGMTFCHMETHQTPTCLINSPHATKSNLQPTYFLTS